MTSEQKLREALQQFADAVEKLAYSMPAVNKYTPIFIHLCIDARRALSQPPTSDEGTPTDVILSRLDAIAAQAATGNAFSYVTSIFQDSAITIRQLERTLHAKERELAAPVSPDDERANQVWDLVIEACARAWDDKNKLFYDGSPTELIARIIDERDELQEQLATLQSVSAAPQVKRPCTCHPSDNPPKPCPEKYALSECRAAAAPQEGKAALIQALQTSRDYYESTHDCKTDSYEQGYRDGMEHAEALISDLSAPPPATPRGDGGEE